MFKDIPSIFELLTYLTQLIIQLCLHDKAFTITYFQFCCCCKSTTTRVINIEMVPICHTSAQSLGYIYFSNIVDYFDFAKSLLGVTGSLIRNLCTEFGISIPHFFLLFSLHIQDIQWEKIFIVFCPNNCKYIFRMTLSLHYTRLILVDKCRCKYAQCISYYVLKSSYILNIRPKPFENELPAHHTLRFTQGCGIYQIVII